MEGMVSRGGWDYEVVVVEGLGGAKGWWGEDGIRTVWEYRVMGLQERCWYQGWLLGGKV